MQSQDRIPYLAGLSLFMSTLELFIPRPLPFFRIGLANIPLLLALDMDAGSLLLLAFLKGIGSSYISGNLFSIFLLISVSQSAVSAMAMKAAYSAGASVYAVSSAGALASTLIQLFLASLYAGQGILSFMPLMLIISLASSLLTAFLSKRIKLSDEIKIESSDGGRMALLTVIPMIITCGIAMMLSSIPVLIAALFTAFVFQHACRRRILALPHIMLFAFMMISSILTPSGEVMTRFLGLPITEGALREGVGKSLGLSTCIALSQGFSAIIMPGKGIIGKSLAVYASLLSGFRKSAGSIQKRVEDTLLIKSINKSQYQANNIPIFTIFCILSIFIALIIIEYLFF